jgi:hypothetical protein
MAHEARTDWSMLLGSVFLLMVGAGPCSWMRYERTISKTETIFKQSEYTAELNPVARRRCFG